MMHYGKLLCLILLLAFTQAAHGETLESLMAAGELEARVVVETPDPLFQKAPIMIAVEVGTPFHFKEGTRVRDFTVPGTLVRPASKFAKTVSRRKGGDSWSFQTVRFRLYPERAGALPPTTLTTLVSIETETQGIVEGEIKLQTPAIEVEAPPGTEGLTSWVAAPEFTVEESWENVLETYQVGDAVTRIRRFTIKDVPAMSIHSSPENELDGIQVYRAPALVEDKVVGTSLKGIREERMVFTVKAGGTHTIPGHRIHWFNLKTQSVEQIELPERPLDVSGSATTNIGPTAESKDKAWNTMYWVLALVIVLGLVLCYLLLRWLRRTPWYHAARDRLELWRGHRRAKADFMRAASQQDSRRCLALLYERMSEHSEWQLSTVCAADQQLSSISAALMAHAYGEGQPPEVSELQLLWEVCTTHQKLINSQKELRLNPGPSQETFIDYQS